MFVETVQVASLETYTIYHYIDYIPNPDWSLTPWVPYEEVHITLEPTTTNYVEPIVEPSLLRVAWDKSRDVSKHSGCLPNTDSLKEASDIHGSVWNDFNFSLNSSWKILHKLGWKAMQN